MAIIRTDNKNCGTWPLVVVTGIYPGKDGIVRAVEVKTAQGTLERPTQHLYPLELIRDSAGETATNVPSVQLNPETPLFRPSSCFSKVPKFFVLVSGAAIPFISSQRRGSKP